LGGIKTCAQVPTGTVDYGLDYVRGDGVRLTGYKTQIGQDVLLTGRVLQGVVSDWAQQLCLGSCTLQR
jgi:hypothetical protein